MPERVGPMRESEQSFFWLWVAVTGVGWFLLDRFNSPWPNCIGIMGMATGQWLLLRQRHVEKAGWWVPATLVGLVIGIAAGGITGGWLQDRLDGVVDPHVGIQSPRAPGRSIVTFLAATAFAGACVGSAMATAQWRILRRQAGHEWCWLAVNIVTLSLAAVVPVFFDVHGDWSVGSSLAVGIVVGVGTGGALIHCLSAGGRVSPVSPRSDWLARLFRTLWPPAAGRWLVYYPICLAVLGLMAIVVGSSILLGPALGAPAEGVLGLVLGTLYLAVSIGLAKRNLWAWRVNYWGLLLIQPITLAGVLGLWQVERFPLLTAWRGGMMLFLGLWSALNMRYFQKRRYLFEAKKDSSHATAPR
jgi:hypothetical protein